MTTENSVFLPRLVATSLRGEQVILKEQNHDETAAGLGLIAGLRQVYAENRAFGQPTPGRSEKPASALLKRNRLQRELVDTSPPDNTRRYRAKSP